MTFGSNQVWISPLKGDALQQVFDRLKGSAEETQFSILNSQLSIKKEPLVSVGIVSAEEIVFTLNAPYMAKGEVLTGSQTVAFSEGGILWRGSQYRELTFTPQEEGESSGVLYILRGLPILVNIPLKDAEAREGAIAFVS